MKYQWLLAVLIVAAVGCTDVPLSQGPFLPLLDPPAPGQDEVFLTAAFGGIPVVDRGCVRIRAGSSTSTVLWHHGTELDRDATGYFLRNAKTGTGYRFGQVMSFGGGEMPREWVEAQNPEVARRCGPPYSSGWLPK